MHKHGHLFFPGLLPREVVMDARREALALCQSAGWVDPGPTGLNARWLGGSVPSDASEEWARFYREWTAAPRFGSVPEHPALLDVMTKLLGSEVLLHPRKIGRVGFPLNEGQQTPIHQDYFHIRGTVQTFTAWVPLGDVPQVLGCLAIADSSHELGFREHQPSPGPGGYAVQADSDALWRSEDFSAGDVVIFHSLTMHRALPNRTENEVRISLDNRYQRASDEVDPSSLKPHA